MSSLARRQFEIVLDATDESMVREAFDDLSFVSHIRKAKVPLAKTMLEDGEKALRVTFHENAMDLDARTFVALLGQLPEVLYHEEVPILKFEEPEPSEEQPQRRMLTTDPQGLGGPIAEITLAPCRCGEGRTVSSDDGEPIVESDEPGFEEKAAPDKTHPSITGVDIPTVPPKDDGEGGDKK